MKPVVLTDIPFPARSEELADRLGAPREGELARDFAGLLEEARRLARPKALYRVAFVEERGEDYVVAAGVRLKSRVLAVNLRGRHRLFPFAATCGEELEEWSKRFEDPLLRFWAEGFKEAALRAASAAVKEALRRRFGLGKTATMNPGALPDWPLQEQEPLFRLLGQPEKHIGLRLTESMMMKPVKSLSGVLFETDSDYHNCRLCPRRGCPGRSAPYDPDLWEQRYAPH